MATFRQAIDIRRPIAEVFDYVTDPANYPSWQPSLVSIHPARPGPLRLGAEVTEVRRFLGREMETTWTCVEHERPWRSAIADENGPVPFVGTFELESEGHGRTRFGWTIETGRRAHAGANAKAMGGTALALSLLGGPLVARTTRQEMATNVERLREVLESAEAPPAVS